MDKPQPLQPEELKAIEARCEAATPGPWVATISPDGTVAMVDHATLRLDDADEPLMIASCDVIGNLDNDADFIAHARSDIPRLIATIEEMAGEVAQSHVTVRKNAELALENKNLSEQIEKTTLARVLALERELAKRDKRELRIREEMVGWLKSQRVDGYSAGLAEATTRIFAILDTATIEEARREQPVPITQIQIDDAKRAVGALRYCIEADAWKGFEAAIRPLFVAQGVLSVAALPAELAAAPKEGTDG
jgi:hypothetical protein